MESRDIDDRCTEDYECKEGTCIGGTCQMKQLGDQCSSHKQCSTGLCWDWVCAYEDWSQEIGEPCGRDKDCYSNYCKSDRT